MVMLIFFIVLWYSSLFCQTFFQHRYAAHGAFKMNKFWERVFFILTYIAQGSSYMSPRAYAIMHRMHHAYTDTDNDPHSPSFSKNVFAMMLRTRNIYNSIFFGTMQVEPRFLKNLPEWPAFDRWANSTPSRLLWVAVYLGFFIMFAHSPWVYLLLPVVLCIGAFHGAIINWFAHKYGYKNYKLENTSNNLLMVDVLMMGESYHNNHHKHPSSINFGVKWHEFDPVYPIIRFLGWLRIIKIQNTGKVITPIPAKALNKSTFIKKMVILAPVFFIAVAAHSQPSWELKKDNDGIKVYTKSIPNTNLKAVLHPKIAIHFR